MTKDTLKLRYERPKTDLLGVMDTIFIFWEFVIPEHQGKGVGLMYRMMEYHRDIIQLPGIKEASAAFIPLLETLDELISTADGQR